MLKIKTDNKTPIGETGCLSIFLRPLPWVNSTPPWLLKTMKVSTSSELYPNTRLFFLKWLGIQFFNSLTCDFWDTRPCQRSLTLLPKEVENFPGGGNHSGNIPLLTYLAWLQPICYNSRLIFIHVNTEKVLLMVKTLIKNIEQQLN